MVNPLVSVIIPAYNVENYIKNCIDSVVNQTYSNLEILVINDGSTDGTGDILCKLSDSRLRVFSFSNNGATAAKNLGLKICRGDFIQYLDADDFLSLDKIEKQLSVIKDFENSIAVCRTIVNRGMDYSSSEEIDTDMISKEGTGIEFLLRLLGQNGDIGMVQPNAYLIPRSIIDKVGPWDEDLYPAPDEDGEYFARVLLNASNVKFTGGINYYRKVTNRDSVSKKCTLESSVNQLNVIERKFQHIFQLNNSPRVHKLYQLNISHAVYQYGFIYPELIPIAKKKLEHIQYKHLSADTNRHRNILYRFVCFEVIILMKYKFRYFLKKK